MGVSLVRFYERRARRLLPALFVMLAAFTGAAVIAGTFDARDAAGVMSSTFYVQNFAQAGLFETPRSLAHMWSLSAEEQFYLVWPILLIALLVKRRRLAMGLVVATIGLCMIRQVELFVAGDPWNRMAFAPDTRSVAILVGCLLALVLATERNFSLPRLAAPLAVGGLIAFALVARDSTLFSAVPPLLPFSLVAAALIVCCLEADSWLTRSLSTGPATYVGRISYSLYLWHLPLLAIVVWPIAIPASFAAAALSHRYVERPFRRRRNEPRRSPRRDVGSTSPRAAAEPL